MDKQVLNDNICRNLLKNSDSDIRKKLDLIFEKITKADSIIHTGIRETHIRWMIWHALKYNYDISGTKIAKIYELRYNSIKEGINKINSNIHRPHQPHKYNNKEIYKTVVIPMIQSYFL